MMPIKHAAGIVLFAKTKPLHVLLLKHRDRWDLPKGHAEPNEDARQTAIRETAEETGIPPAEISLDHSFRFEIEYDVANVQYGNYRKHVTYFLGFVQDQQEVTPTEHVGFRWFAWPVGPLQAETIDPLFSAVTEHFATRGIAD